MASAAVSNADAAVAHPLYTSTNEMPVSPSRVTTASGLSTSKLPPTANCTSFHPMPASAQAARIASAPICSADLGPKRPNGWRPTPMIATSYMLSPAGSLYRPEGVGEHRGGVGVGAERDDDKLELHAEPYLLRIADRQPPFDPDLVSELDEADAERPECLLGLAARVRFLRQELLRGPGPQRAAA